ncbi:MAG: hypothetical protein FJ297_12920 [Planctomycetes bacterium]|nr:hypothetical protein [Planctomycetota bacterium]
MERRRISWFGFAIGKWTRPRIAMRAAAFAWLVVPVAALGEPPSLAFRSSERGLYAFDTGAMRGVLKVDGAYQGIYPLVDATTGRSIVHPPGLLSPYRVFSTNRRYGDAARDWPTETRLRNDGSVECRWPAADEHPVAITGVYRWIASRTIDLELTVTPRVDMPQFELFVSSYLTESFVASVAARDERGAIRFERADRPVESKGQYVMFPIGDGAAARIRDGRWSIGPSPVDWDLGRAAAAPLALRRDTSSGLAALLMARPGDCFAVSCPWNPATPGAPGYRSLYLSLFGRDLSARESADARCRWIIAPGMTDAEAVRHYEAFAAD